MIIKRGKGDFHRVYRPCRISEMVGNYEVKRVIENAFKENKVPHTFLFHGLSGTGKTTMARIIKMGLNCEKGPTSEPCCECGYCKRMINLSDSLAVIEINAVEFLKDELKEILHNFHGYNSGAFEGLNKNICIVDECHGLTDDQAGLFLKYTEYVPEWNYYVFCTTDPEKVLHTLRNRCVIQVEFKKIPNEEIMNLLSEICELENLQYDKESLKGIVSRSDGMARQAVHLLQQEHLVGNIKEKKIHPHSGKNVQTIAPHERIIETEKVEVKNDIKAIPGNTPILLIAPHGHCKDDENTYEMAEQMARELDCYAVLNKVYQKPPYKKSGEPERKDADKNKKWIDLNDIGQVETFLKEEFLQPIVDFKNEIVTAYGSALIILIHGIDDANINDIKMVSNLGGKKDLLIGIGQFGKSKGDIEEYETRSAFGTFRARRLIESFNNNKIKAALAPIESGYCGWDINNMNQLFNQKKEHKIYYDSRVKSVQLEIKMKNRREGPDQARKTGTLFAKVFTEFVEFTKPIKKVNIDDIQVKNETDRQYIFRVIPDTDEEIKKLADDIKKNKLIHPLVLLQKKNGKYLLLCGYRRFQALKLLKEKWVEAKIYQEGDLSEEEFMHISLSENTQRRNLNPIEIGAFLQAVQNRLKLSLRDLAANYGNTLGIGTSHGSIQKYIKLNKIREIGESKDLISDVLNGKIQFGVASEVFAFIDDEKDRDALFKHVYKRLNPTRPEIIEIKKLLGSMGDRIEAVLKTKNVQASINKAEKSKQKAQKFIDLLRIKNDDAFAELKKQEKKFDKKVLQIRKSFFGAKATEDEFTIMRPPDMEKNEMILQFMLTDKNIEKNLAKITGSLGTKAKSKKFKDNIQELMDLLVSP